MVGHYLSTLQNLLRLHERTPRSMVYMMVGSLPARGILHQRQMTLFSMICHLKDDPLHSHAEYVLLHLGNSCKSWFLQVRAICLPLPKQTLKNLVKTKVTDYWYHLLTAEATPLPSLTHSNSNKHSLSEPHPLWYAAGSSPHEVTSPPS